MDFDNTWVSIDLDAIQANFDAVQAKAGVQVMAIIKADAYGHGAVQVARLLQDQCAFFGVSSMLEAVELRQAGVQTPILILGYTPAATFGAVQVARLLQDQCAFFGVSSMLEAVELRQAGVQTPILILGYTPAATFSAAVDQNIRPAIFRWEDALALSQTAQALGKTAPFHFALDTGMSRIGVQATEEAADLCARIAALPGLEAEGLFSHFATADCADLTRAKAQAACFDRFDAMLRQRGVAVPIRHGLEAEGLFSHFATADCADLTRAKAQAACFDRFDAMLRQRGVAVPIRHLKEAEGLFSHFATADCADLTRAKAQAACFDRFDAMLRQRGVAVPIRHLNNSAGLMNFDRHYEMVRSGIVTYGLYPSDQVDPGLLALKPALEWFSRVSHVKTLPAGRHYEMVRSGIVTYGLYPSDQVDPGLLALKPALEWFSRVSHVKTLPAGREISYGGTYVTEKPTVVATVPAGYADGYRRSLSGKFHVLIHGQKAPIEGPDFGPGVHGPADGGCDGHPGCCAGGHRDPHRPGRGCLHHRGGNRRSGGQLQL